MGDSMRESLFENESALTMDVAKEITSQVTFKKREVIVLTYAMYVAGPLLGLVGILRGDIWFILLGINTILAWPIIRMVLRPSAVRRLLELQAPPTNTVKYGHAVFFADSVEYGDYTFRYNQISETIEAKLCLYIMVEKSEKDHALAVVKKDAFTKGDYEAFVSFLRERLEGNQKALKGLK